MEEKDLSRQSTITPDSSTHSGIVTASDADSLGKVSLLTKVGYATGSLGDSAAYYVVTSFLSFYLTTVAGISPKVAGIIIGLATVWDAITDPLMGILIDHSKSRYGKRRPFIIGSLAPLSAAIIMLFISFDASSTVKTAYYIFMVLVFWTAYTAFNISFYSLGAAITSNDDERIKISGFREVAAFVGVFCGTSVPTFIVGRLVKTGMGTSTSWTIAAVIVAAIMTIAILVMWYSTRGKEPIGDAVDAGAQHSWKESLAGIVELTRLRPYVMIILSALFASVYMTLFNSDLLYYTSFVMGLSEDQSSVLWTVSSICSVAFIPFLAKLGMVFDKRSIYIAGMVFSGVCMIAARFTGLPSLTWAVVYIILVSVGTAAYWMFLFNFLYDVIDIDEFRTGKKRDGLIMSYYSFLLKLGGAIAAFLMGLMLEAAKFDGEAETQVPSAIEAIKDLFTIYPGIFMVISGAVMIFSPAIRSRMKALHLAKARRDAGQDYSTDGFAELLKGAKS